ncbi:unnamed protein product [Rotaria magnacalcarata]|uniref:C2H2-type domain-containing protein n=1 Tax=Rotaria magnacalcarata TaxID=392030 RepID=A0A815ZU06_9BILA|nr:unnamed protein product [Rotaria magnacalcarata]CAF4019510.1 unnamed protein product [Rotaria magnacalcarata]
MSSVDFVAAAKSTKNLSIFSCNLPSEKHNEKFKWEGVSKYNNIEFNLKRTLSSSKRTTTISTLSPLDIDITTWRAFTIGNGKTFQLSNFKSSVTNIVPLEFEDGALSIDNSWKSEESFTTDSNSNDSMDVDQEVDNFSTPSSSSQSLLWDCPVENCIRQYRRYNDLQYHLDTGKHTIAGTKMLLLDQAKTMLKSLTENDTHRSSITLQNFNTIQDVNDKTTNILSKGWALSLSKINTRFTELQKKYLNDAYIKGEETGFKYNPDTLSLEMPFVKDNGQFRFAPDECLTASQIKIFFSCLTRKRRKQIDNIRRFSNEPTATNTQQVHSNDTDDETDDDESSEYDSHIAAQDMADLQQTS